MDIISDSHPTRFPRAWFWLTGAPVAVAACLLFWHSVFVVFAVYHLGFCLFLPLVHNLIRRRRSFVSHLLDLGLTGPGAPRRVLQGLGMAVLLAAGTLMVFHRLGPSLLADQNIPETLSAWGVTPGNLSFLFWFMVLVNAPAEELYWRGFVHTLLSDRRPRSGTILVTAACYASYHGLTVYLLVANLPVALLFMTAILAAGVGWGWLREKTGSVWPALLGHAGAVIGYMVVARPFLDM